MDYDPDNSIAWQVVQRLLNRPLKQDLRGDLFSPYYNSYDSLGRGADAKKAILFEALANRIGAFQSPEENIPFDKMISRDIYPVSPDFIEPGYYGSGTYASSGPLEGTIALNANKPYEEIMNRVLPHEIVHKNTDNMGGVVGDKTEFFKNIEKFVSLIESKQRIPNELLAYGWENTLNNKNIKYYIPGDFKRKFFNYED